MIEESVVGYTGADFGTGKPPWGVSTAGVLRWVEGAGILSAEVGAGVPVLARASANTKKGRPCLREGGVELVSVTVGSKAPH